MGRNFVPSLLAPPRASINAITPDRTRLSTPSPNAPLLLPSRAMPRDRTPGHLRTRSQSVTRIALLQLDFLVVGAGIAGLGVAFALARAGHRVRVLEKAPALARRAGGVRVPPNLSKILVEWGLEDALKACGVRCKGSTFYDLHTGDRVGWLEWNDDVMNETGGSFLLMHHGDLHRMVYELAMGEGARVDFGVDVESVHPGDNDEEQEDDDQGRPYVRLASGEVIYADIIIGADGYKSIVRPVVLGREDEGEATAMSIYTATIPMSVMMEDPELAEFARQPEWPIWMGDRRSVLGYPIDLTWPSEQRPEQTYAVHLFWPDARADAEEGWEQEVAMDLDFTGCDPRVQKLMRLVPSAVRSKYQRREAIEEWVDASGRIVLIGEAAHPTLPCSTHGCSLALEDAAVLGTLFARLKSWDQVGPLLDAFVELRQARCVEVNNREVANKDLVQMPPGAARRARDAAMREAVVGGRDRWDETKLRRQWDEIAKVFAYNAFDAGEDWYVSWGALREVSKERRAYEEVEMQAETVEAEEGGVEVEV